MVKLIKSLCTAIKLTRCDGVNQVPLYCNEVNQFPLYCNQVNQIRLYCNQIHQVPLYYNQVTQTPVYCNQAIIKSQWDSFMQRFSRPCSHLHRPQLHVPVCLAGVPRSIPYVIVLRCFRRRFISRVWKGFMNIFFTFFKNVFGTDFSPRVAIPVDLIP